MIRFALSGLLGRKLRTALTALAIVLGVAMVSGTLVLTDSIDKAFNFIYTDVRQGSDAVISGKSAIGDTQNGQGTFAPTIDGALLAKVRTLPDVQDAEGSVTGDAQLIDRNGKGEGAVLVRSEQKEAAGDAVNLQTLDGQPTDAEFRSAARGRETRPG